MLRRLALVGVASLLAGGTGVPAAAPARPVLWVWERPTDLGFIDPARVEVAVLSQTLSVRGGRLSVTPRQQPLRVPAGATVVPVTRIEAAGLVAADAPAALRAEMVEAIAATAARAAVRTVQVDFEARRSQRALYRELLGDVRRRLPPAVGLSITALASWCLHDRWLEGLPVSEVVPMLFRMGPETAAVYARLESGGDFPRGVCRGAVGVAVEEGLRWMPRGRRAWVFSADGWTPATVADVLRRAGTGP